MCENVNVTVWSEGREERADERVADVYPDGVHGAIAAGLEGHPGIRKVRTATLDEPEHGLADEVLADTDVLIWWGHEAHDEVRDGIVEKVYRRVMAGMGLIPLHSSLFAKPFVKLMGTDCTIASWREEGEKERLWVVCPGHPIAEGLGDYLELPQTEMYGEHFNIPAPDELVFVSWFEGGEVCRSGCCFCRGRGKVFYFRPGHETYPIFYDPQVRRVIYNAVRWAAPPEGSVFGRGDV